MSTLTRWTCKIYSCDTDTSAGNYNASGEVLESTIAALSGVHLWSVNITAPRWKISNAGVVETDISGRPFAAQRGYTDQWTISSIPFSFDDSDFDFATIQAELPDVFNKKHIWITFTGITSSSSYNIAATKVVKVVPETYSETDNDSAGKRTFTLSFRRKYRND